MQDRLQLSDSVSELFVFGAKRLQLILQLSLLLLGKTQLLKLPLQLQAKVGLLLKWIGSEETNQKKNWPGVMGPTSQAKGVVWNSEGLAPIQILALVIPQSLLKVLTCRSCSTASPNCCILLCRVSISPLLAVIFSCMSMAAWRPAAKARPSLRNVVFH